MTDSEPGRPLYLRIGDAIRHKIESGELAPGARVGSDAALIAEWNTTRQTVRQALDVLRAEGLIVREHGRGTFVRRRPTIDVQWPTDRYRRRPDGPTSPFARDAQQAGAIPDWQWNTRRERADEQTANRLHLDTGAYVMITSYTFRADNNPVQLSTSWEPYELVGGTPIEEPEGGPGPSSVIARFDAIGIRITEVVEIVRARPATADERRQLGMPAGSWVQTVERTHLAGELPVETCDIVRPADQAARGYRIPID